jgi:hypothetical protein
MMAEKNVIETRIFPDKKENKPNRQDQVFADTRPLVTDFQFDKKTADVFDDMVGRSVPFYPQRSPHFLLRYPWQMLRQEGGT